MTSFVVHGHDKHFNAQFQGSYMNIHTNAFNRTK